MTTADLQDGAVKLRQHIETDARNRLVTLTDGVFAIVITLAALEMHPPATIPSTAAALWRLLLPSLIPYGLTFLVIAAYWSGHRRMIARLHLLDGVALGLSLLFVGLVALQPAGLQLLMHPGTTSSAASIYLALVLLTSIVQALLWSYACFIARLAHPALDRRALLGRLLSILLLPLAATSISLASMKMSEPPPALAMVLAVAIVIVSQRLADREPSRSAPHTVPAVETPHADSAPEPPAQPPDGSDRQ